MYGVWDVDVKARVDDVVFFVLKMLFWVEMLFWVKILFCVEMLFCVEVLFWLKMLLVLVLVVLVLLNKFLVLVWVIKPAEGDIAGVFPCVTLLSSSMSLILIW